MSANDENLPSKVVPPPVAMKRSITVRKIAPRKTQALSNSNKENVVERISEVSTKRSKVLTSSPAISAEPKTSVLSPILPSSSPPPPQPTESEQDSVWSQKVRRSYSRLSMGDKSFESPKPARSSSPHDRQTLFGFERLQTPEVMRKTEGSRSAPLGSMSFSVGSFNISADESASNPPEVDPNIPGVCLGKKTTRRKRVQQIKMSELDVLAAKMNAEFEEAESFELFVE